MKASSLRAVVAIKPPKSQLPTETAEPLWKIRNNKTSALLLADTLESRGYVINWQSATGNDSPSNQRRRLRLKLCNRLETFHWPTHPTVLALVPHWRCEPWLSRCLSSLCQQTYPLTHIVVIDDASKQPPTQLIQKLSEQYSTPITLLQSAARVGPYNLVQSVVDRTNYTAYLFQDADDWSSCDRLETLLKTAAENNAELVGSQEIRITEPEGHLQGIGYPLDVNLALQDKPGHALLHPTSLITRSAIVQLGGFATGLKFGADSEFLLRARWKVRAVNSDRFCYFRRKRPHSLTTAPATGLNSPARIALLRSIKQRSRFLSQQAKLGNSLDLRPLCCASPASLKRLWGPPLQQHSQVPSIHKTAGAT